MQIKYFSSLASFPAPAVQLDRKIQLLYQLLSLEKGEACSADVFAVPHLEPTTGQESARCTFHCSKAVGEFLASLNSVWALALKSGWREFHALYLQFRSQGDQPSRNPHGFSQAKKNPNPTNQKNNNKSIPCIFCVIEITNNWAFLPEPLLCQPAPERCWVLPGKWAECPIAPKRLCYGLIL